MNNPYGFNRREPSPEETNAALNIAVDALRKIRLGHPCDVHEIIAAVALENMAEAIK